MNWVVPRFDILNFVKMIYIFNAYMQHSFKWIQRVSYNEPVSFSCFLCNIGGRSVRRSLIKNFSDSIIDWKELKDTLRSWSQVIWNKKQTWQTYLPRWIQSRSKWHWPIINSWFYFRSYFLSRLKCSTKFTKL